MYATIIAEAGAIVVIVHFSTFLAEFTEMLVTSTV